MSAERVVFEFFEFDPATQDEKLVENLVDSFQIDEADPEKATKNYLSKKHKPIIIEAEDSYNNAYVAKNFETSKDSFVIILYSTLKRIAPKVMKF